MKTRAAVAWKAGEPLTIETLDLDSTSVEAAGSSMGSGGMIANRAAELMRHRIKRLVLVDALPRNATGKILKKDIRAGFIAKL